MGNGQYSSFIPVGEVRVNPHTPHSHSLSDSPLLIAMGITVMWVAIIIIELNIFI